MEYVPSNVRDSGAVASAGGAGGAEARTEGFLDPASSTTVASWTTMSPVSFFLHSQRRLQRQPQQQRMKITLVVSEMRDHPMKFPFLFFSSPWSSFAEELLGEDVGPDVGAVGPPVGAYVVGPSVGAKTGLAVGLPGVTVGAGVGTGVGLGKGLDVGGRVGFGDGAIDGS